MIDSKTLTDELATLIGGKIDNAHDDRAFAESDEERETNEVWETAEYTKTDDGILVVMLGGRVLRIRVDDITD